MSFSKGALTQHVAETGNIYYFNEVTKQSTWKRPNAVSAEFDGDKLQLAYVGGSEVADAVRHSYSSMRDYSRPLILEQQCQGSLQSGAYLTNGVEDGYNIGLLAARQLHPFPHIGPGPPIQTTEDVQGPVGCNLFIFHIPNDMMNVDLYNYFSVFGNVISARIMIEKETGRSRGFGFVSFDNPASAKAAIHSMDGFQVGRKRLKVQLKKERGFFEEQALLGGSSSTSSDISSASVPLPPLIKPVLGASAPAVPVLIRPPPPPPVPLLVASTPVSSQHMIFPRQTSPLQQQQLAHWHMLRQWQQQHSPYFLSNFSHLVSSTTLRPPPTPPPPQPVTMSELHLQQVNALQIQMEQMQIGIAYRGGDRSSDLSVPALLSPLLGTQRVSSSLPEGKKISESPADVATGTELAGVISASEGGVSVASMVVPMHRPAPPLPLSEHAVPTSGIVAPPELPSVGFLAPLMLETIPLPLPLSIASVASMTPSLPNGATLAPMSASEKKSDLIEADEDPLLEQEVAVVVAGVLGAAVGEELLDPAAIVAGF